MQADKTDRPRHQTRLLDHLCLAPGSAEIGRGLPAGQEARLCKGCAVPKVQKGAMHNEMHFILIGRCGKVHNGTTCSCRKGRPWLCKADLQREEPRVQGKRRAETRGNMWQPFDRPTNFGRREWEEGWSSDCRSFSSQDRLRLGPCGERVLDLTRAARVADARIVRRCQGRARLQTRSSFFCDLALFSLNYVEGSFALANSSQSKSRDQERGCRWDGEGDGPRNTAPSATAPPSLAVPTRVSTPLVSRIAPAQAARYLQCPRLPAQSTLLYCMAT